MLFHITMTHTPENCPAYLSTEEQKKFFAQAEKMPEVVKEMSIKVHFMLAGVGHTMYSLIEADNFITINNFLVVFRLSRIIKLNPLVMFMM